MPYLLFRCLDPDRVLVNVACSTPVSLMFLLLHIFVYAKGAKKAENNINRKTVCVGTTSY
jgi:hypothetical protein